MGLLGLPRNHRSGSPVVNPATEIDVLRASARSILGDLEQQNTSAEESKDASLCEDMDVVDAPDVDAQKGVQNAQAITLTWSKRSLALAYIFMFLLYFVNAFQSSITSNLSAYVVSDFESHSLIPVISIVSNVMGAAVYMPLAKALNLWDRSIGFAVMATFATIGLVLSATCTDIAIYCASQVFYTVGFAGMIFAIDVMTVDTSSLRDRGLAFAFTSSPYIITAFAGPAAAQHFYDFNWRWAYGLFAIVLPVVATPLFVGVFLLAAGLAIFLLPFSLAASSTNEWQTPHIIVLLVVGLLCLTAFGIVERWFSPRPFIPYALLTNRSVLGACLLDLTYQISYSCWNSYFSSYLQVTFNTSISVAGYIAGIFDVVAGIWLIVVGFLIRRTGYYRWLLMVAVPIYILGIGLMIHFRKPGGHFGFIIMCQVFTAFGGGTMIDCQQVAVVAAASHNDAAAVLALLGLFGSVGGAIGNSVSGAIWTNTLPKALRSYLPEESLGDWKAIYDSLDTQLSYPVGSETRTAIINAYAEAQSRMLIASISIMALSLIWIFVIKNIRVTDIQQAKGVLF
nr:siderophore iron transporter MirB [Cryptococcus depauperatus CBS 7855]